MTTLPVTSFFVAMFALALVTLSVAVTVRRVKLEIGLAAVTTLSCTAGSGARQFHGIYPSFLIGRALVEADAAASWIVLRIGGTFAFGRILHAVGMFGASTPLRGLGILMTHPGLLAISELVAVHFPLDWKAQDSQISCAS